MSTSWRATGGALAIAAAATLALAGCSSSGLNESNADRPITNAVSTDSAGTNLATETVGGGCQSASLSASENQESVTLTLHVKTRTVGGACAASEHRMRAEVHLQHPLDGRTLLDGITGSKLTVSTNG